MKVEVISLGGSLLFREGRINYKYIEQFRKLLNSYRNRKFVVVVGGGSVARFYINALDNFGANNEFMSHFGIAVTRMNARMLANAFGKNANTRTLPKSLKDVKNLLAKHKIVFCGGLRYEKDQTSDGTAAHIANFLKARFINMTNVKGLYTKNPREYASARFIPRISYAEFDKRVRKIRYRPGQHFVLDQHASYVIKKNKVPTYIIGGSLRNFKRLLDGESFVGTTIS